MQPTLRVRLFSAALLLLVSHASASAQAPAPTPDAPPRVQFASFHCEPTACRPEGPPVAATGLAVALDVSGPPARHEFDAAGRLAARRGRSHALAGAGIGFVLGAGATFALLYSGGSTSPCDRSANQDAMTPRECIGLTALGGLAGAGLGAVIGAQLRAGPSHGFSVERRRVAAAPLPARGVGLAVAVAF